MGLFDSDYKAKASVVNNQLMPQRHRDDTFFGELVLQNNRTGENVADNIRYDIMEGVTASLRRYNKEGKKQGFSSFVNFPADLLPSDTIGVIEGDTGRSITRLISGSWQENWSPRNKNDGELSITREYFLQNHTFEGIQCIGQKMYKDTSVMKGIVSDVTKSVNRKFTYYDGTTETIHIPLTDFSEGFRPMIFSGFYAVYMSGNRKYFHWSEDQKYRVGSKQSYYEVMPIVSLQDNMNAEYPYGTLPLGDIGFIKREKVMKKVGADFFEVSLQVFPFIPEIWTDEWKKTYGNQLLLTPALLTRYKTEQAYYEHLTAKVAIPAFESQEWNRDYGRGYDSRKKDCKRGKNVTEDMQEFCDDFNTEREYYDSLVEDKEKAEKTNENITDVHFGFFATAKTLDESNVIALYYTLLPLLSQMTQRELYEELYNPCIDDPTSFDCINYNADQREKNRVVSTYQMAINAGSLIIEYSFQEWSVLRRYGVANPTLYPSDVSPKRNHTGFTIIDDVLNSNPLVENPKDLTYEYTRDKPIAIEPNDPYEDDQDHGTWYNEIIPDTIMELRIQDKPDKNGNPRYLEMRLYSPTAKQLINTNFNKQSKDSEEEWVEGGLAGFHEDDPDKPYSDVLCFPISYEAMRKVPMFKRERLIRETMILRVSAIDVQEVKWYYKGWFRVVMIVAALVVTYFTAGAGTKGMIAVLKAIAVMAVVQIVMALTDNPILRGIVQIIAIFYGGYVSTGSFSVNPAMIVEAAGVVAQTHIALEMIKLKEDVADFMKEMNEERKKFEEMEEEVGNDNFNKDFMLYLTGVSPVESQEEFMKRTLNSELPENKVALPDTGSKLGTPYES